MILYPYFQDDWRITSRLTLNRGLRVSLYRTYREKQKQAFNFDPARYVFGQTSVDPNTGNVIGLTANGLPPSVSNLPNGLVQCGVTPGVPVSCMQGHLFNPAPRIGFAWDPKGDGRTAIRGGYGVFFEQAKLSTRILHRRPSTLIATRCRSTALPYQRQSLITLLSEHAALMPIHSGLSQDMVISLTWNGNRPPFTTHCRLQFAVTLAVC